ncbi:hypothetical protein GTO27_00650 [Candidatus Bathyarchaeota archaeon]|nr:hypothetical protein [Candidatus Bathyarchaeota archaeon]
MNMELKAELIMAVSDYECEERQEWNRGVDFRAIDSKSDVKTLFRVITEPKTRSGVVGIDGVRRMAKKTEQEEYAKGFLISNRFSKAAKKEIGRKRIKIVSEGIMPEFSLQKTHLKMRDRIGNLYGITCGHVPEKESDCEGLLDDHYTCRIRLISDNAAFHLELGWISFLQNGFAGLLAMNSQMSKQDTQWNN